MAGRCADPVREPPDRVVVLPALAVHDLQRLDRREGIGHAGVGGRGARDLLPGVERLGRRAGRQRGLLRDADDAQAAAG